LAIQVFQTLEDVAINPTLFATVKETFARVMAGQRTMSPSGADNVGSLCDEGNSDLFGEWSIALAGRRARRDVTADPIIPPTMVQVGGADQDACDRYFAQMVNDADQGTGDE
jgi:hypothetical protein